MGIGSTNQVKVAAIEQAFRLYHEGLSFLPLDVPSGVNPFPMSESETLTGAINRARAVKAARPDVDYSVGIESGVCEVVGAKFVRSYAAVIHLGVLGLGSSAAYEAPEPIISRIDPTSDLSRQVIDDMLGRREVLSQEGIVGVLTERRLSRASILRDAVICALTRFTLPEQYTSDINECN